MSTEGTITHISARALYDSNGRAAIEVAVVDRAGRSARALAPRGSSIGDFEPEQLEDEALQPRLAAVTPAVRMIAEKVEPALRGLDAVAQQEIDRRLNELDTSPRRSTIGGNVTIATSMAVAELGARQQDLALHDHLRRLYRSEAPEDRGPLAALNLIDGGLSPASTVPHIEFLLFPRDEVDLADGIATGICVHARVRALCHERGYEGATSQQGAISVPLRSCEEGLDIVHEALRREGAESDYRIGVDMAASDVRKNGSYLFRWSDGPLSTEDLMAQYLGWLEKYPLCYIEDAFSATRTDEFTALMNAVSGEVMIAGDDLFASSPDRIAQGVAGGWANTAVIKPNQAGTVTDTMASAAVARGGGFSVVVSQRSGENGNAFISSLAIAAGARYIKVGGPNRMDRIAKINELIRVAVPR